jgi:hypothetical protein
MRRLRLSKKIKIEGAFALAMAIILLVCGAYFSQPRSEEGGYSYLLSQSEASQRSYISMQQVISENVQGELKSGSFEVVVQSLKNLTYYYDGKMPYLNMLYQDDLWHGDMNCKIPTENVTTFTFDVRQLISAHGKVTRISISVTETETNQTGQAEQQLSTVTIGLKEVAEGSSPILNQIGIAIPYLVTSLVWVAQGLIVIVPLSFVCLGIVMLVNRGIIPSWKKQFRNKT